MVTVGACDSSPYLLTYTIAQLLVNYIARERTKSGERYSPSDEGAETSLADLPSNNRTSWDSSWQQNCYQRAIDTALLTIGQPLNIVDRPQRCRSPDRLDNDNRRLWKSIHNVDSSTLTLFLIIIIS